MHRVVQSQFSMSLLPAIGARAAIVHSCHLLQNGIAMMDQICVMREQARREVLRRQSSSYRAAT